MIDANRNKIIQILENKQEANKWNKQKFYKNFKHIIDINLNKTNEMQFLEEDLAFKFAVSSMSQ